MRQRKNRWTAARQADGVCPATPTIDRVGRCLALAPIVTALYLDPDGLRVLRCSRWTSRASQSSVGPPVGGPSEMAEPPDTSAGAHGAAGGGFIPWGAFPGGPPLPRVPLGVAGGEPHGLPYPYPYPPYPPPHPMAMEPVPYGFGPPMGLPYMFPPPGPAVVMGFPQETPSAAPGTQHGYSIVLAQDGISCSWIKLSQLVTSSAHACRRCCHAVSGHPAAAAAGARPAASASCAAQHCCRGAGPSASRPLAPDR